MRTCTHKRKQACRDLSPSLAVLLRVNFEIAGSPKGHGQAETTLLVLDKLLLQLLATRRDKRSMPANLLTYPLSCEKHKLCAFGRRGGGDRNAVGGGIAAASVLQKRNILPKPSTCHHLYPLLYSPRITYIKQVSISPRSTVAVSLVTS